MIAIVGNNNRIIFNNRLQLIEKQRGVYPLFTVMAVPIIFKGGFIAGDSGAEFIALGGLF